MPASLNGQREGGREGEHQLTLKEGPHDGRLIGAVSHVIGQPSGPVTGYWPGSAVRLCSPLSTTTTPPHSHWGILPSLSDTEGLGQQLRARVHTRTHPITRIHQCWALRMHIYAERCGNFLCQCVNCSCRIRLVMACSVPVLCGMCESALIVFVHMNFRVTLSFCA